MAKRRTSTEACVYRLKVTLQDIRPSIWRRIEVSGTTRLDHLHLMFQAVMGWMNCHLHSLSIGGAEYGMCDPEFGAELEDEKKVHLCDLVTRQKARFRYVYDFGDNWEHDVLVEKIGPPEAGAMYPRCLAGARACPPEDVGGPWGYANFLEAIRDPNHEEHAEYLEWTGGDSDPEAFDAREKDADLKNYKVFDPGIA